ncbi:hypothetical protein P3T39_000421 [Kitasatospora sp. GP82]|nr:hypothetical protein [Kitasatospora sp. GP82]
MSEFVDPENPDGIVNERLPMVVRAFVVHRLTAIR